MILSFIILLFIGSQSSPQESTRLEISTDKPEYIVGDRVKSTFYIANPNPVPVKIEPYNMFNVDAFINGIPQEYGQTTFITWEPGAKITIPSESRHKISAATFKAKEAGNLTINLNIHIRGDLAESIRYTVKIKPKIESITYNESDITEIIRLSLTIALVDKEIPDYDLIKDKENIVLCTENLEGLVPEIDGVNLIMLDLDEIQTKADREGDFLYLRFTKLDMHFDGKGATVHLDNWWMSRRGSPYQYLSGGGLNISFIKESGTWNGRVQATWIS